MKINRLEYAMQDEKNLPLTEKADEEYDAVAAEMEAEASQQKQWETLAKETSESLAFFYCCIRFDRPFDMDSVPRGEANSKWTTYLTNLRTKNRYKRKNGKPYGFLDGQTDICKIFGENLESGEFTKAVYAEKSAFGRKEGTAKQRQTWGHGDEKKPYTSGDYDRLDELFTTYSARLTSAGGYDNQQEYILRQCSRMSLEQEKALASGNIDRVAKLNKVIQDNLGSEGLRKKDAKPIEDVRIDSIVDALERKGLLKNGKQCSPDEMFQILFGRPPKYPYTMDAAEQMILINANRALQNDGLPELQELPENMRLHDDLGEFAQEQSPREVEAYKKLGLIKMPPAKKRGRPKKETE